MPLTTDFGTEVKDFESSDIHNIILKVARTVINGVETTNPLKPFFKGDVSYGAIVEDIVKKLSQAQAYDKGAVNVFAKSATSYETRYFNNWNSRQFTETIEDKELEKVVESEEKLNELVAMTLASMTNSNDNEDYKQLKKLLKQVSEDTSEDNPVAREFMTITADTTMENIITEIRNCVKSFTFVGNTYCAAGFETSTPLKNVYILLPYKLANKISVEKLASLFNLDKADLLGNIIEIDNDDKNIYIVDKNAIGQYNRLRVLTNQYNNKGLYANYFLTVENLYYYSPLFNFAFADASPLFTEVVDDPVEP